MILRNYQREIIKHFKSDRDKNILYCLPTGTGKSVIILAILGALLPNPMCTSKIGVVVPSIELLDNLKAYIISEGLGDRLQLMKDKTIDVDKNIFLGVYKSFYNRLSLLPKLDLMIHDECHHTAGKTWYELTKITRNIGFSATPCRFDGKFLPFDEIFEPYTIDWYMTNGFLCNDVTEYAGEQIIETNKSVDDLSAQWLQAKAKSHGNFLVDWVKYGDNKQTIIYATTIDHCFELYQEFSQITTASIIHSGLNKDIRNNILNDFINEKTKVLINVNILLEGVNIPNVSCVQFCRYFGNIAGYVQAVGRALRPQENKKVVVIDNAGNLTHGSVKNLNGWSEIFYDAFNNPDIEECVREFKDKKVSLPSFMNDVERGSDKLSKYNLTRFEETLLKSIRNKSGKAMISYWEKYLAKYSVSSYEMLEILKVCELVMSFDKAEFLLKNYLG